MVLRSLCRTTTPLLLAAIAFGSVFAQNEYRGKLLGKLSELHHGVSGEVFAVDARTLHIRNFSYDGEGPAAYFYVGNSKAPSGNGFRLRDERGTTNVLPRYRNQDITLTLPEGKSLQNVRWFSVWCDEFAVNFGDVKIPKGFDFPRPFKLGTLGGIHGVSSDAVVIVDAQTLLIPNFSYDGEAPDAKFWVGLGARPSPQGIKIPDENGKIDPLRRYDRKTIVLTLPNDMTVFDIGHFGVWCEAFAVDFGHVQIPQGLNVPPSLKMLGVSPQSKLNCEVLWDELAYEVRWAVAGDSIVLQLVARLEGGEYMSFGISGHDTKSQMVGGDVTVAWVDKDTLKGHARDYFLDAKSQCSGTRGSCPDDRLAENTDNVRLLNAALVNGYSIVTFQRSLKAQDEFDKPIFTNGSQPIIWAIGPLNQRQEVSYHSIANRANILLDFGRPPKWNCPTPESQNVPSPAAAPVRQKPASVNQQSSVQQQSSSSKNELARPKPIATPAPVPKIKPWDIPAIQCNEPEDGVYYAQMGPTGGKRGYPAITGHVGWGISWYINGLLIPEINVVRGRTYTFIVEGGLDPAVPARYHPFYITDDPVGGYEHKTPEERSKVQIFAGAVQNKKGEVRPTGIGRLCNWNPDQSQPPADEFASFGAYQRTLSLVCDSGEPGIVQWTVGADTPDTVYYQCYTHRYLGWKINVHDDCEEGAGSDPQPVYIRPPAIEDAFIETDAEAQPSIQHVTKVKPGTANTIQQLTSAEEKDPPTFTYVPVPQFHFYNEETGEPLDEETIQKMNPDIQKLKSQFLEAIPTPSSLSFQKLPAPQSHAVINFNNDQKFLDFFHTPKPILVQQEASTSKPSYSVEEQQEDEPPALPAHQFQHASHEQFQQGGQDLFQQGSREQFQQGSREQFQQGSHEKFNLGSQNDLPALGLHPYQGKPQGDQNDIPAIAFHPYQGKPQGGQNFPLQQLTLSSGLSSYLLPNHQTERPSTTQQPKLPLFESSTVVDEKFHQEFLKNYHQLQAEAAAKFKKHNQNQKHNHHQPGNSKPTRLQYSAPRRPSPHHAMTLQQRPLPPGMFRPPFLPPPNNKKVNKRPAPSASQKVPSYSAPNNYLAPNKPHQRFPQSQKPQANPTSSSQQLSHHHSSQANFQQMLALQKLLSTITPYEPAQLTTPSYKSHFTTQSTPLFAHNLGFNPSSVKIEGGFKPILNTGISPSFYQAEERMDDMVDVDDVQDDEGVIDLTKSESKQQLSADPTQGVEKPQDVEIEKTEEKEDIFKHLKPVMFEPMFVPSPPDYRIQKTPPKQKKKPIDAKYENIKTRNTYLEPYNAHKNKYVKMRPRPNLIRRPLYPDDVVPPFKIPARGGSPQFRFHESDEGSVEDTTDFDIIEMNEQDSNVTDNNAENIVEVIETQSESNGTDSGKLELVVVNTDDGVVFDNEFQVKNDTEDDEVAMADERQDYYLPPDAAGSTLTYDGRRVVGIAPPPPELPRTFDITKQPQFVPFRGELPSFPASVEGLPQLRESSAARGEILPPVSGLTRKKRSPHHEPGHEGHGDDHEGHDHSHSHSSRVSVPFALVTLSAALFRFL